MTAFQKVKKLLETYPELRSSDKKLLWAYWATSGLTEHGKISKENFYKADASETITRARRDVQEKYPELQATPEVKEARDRKEEKKGSFIHEPKAPKPFTPHKRIEKDNGRDIVVDCNCQIGELHN